MRTRRLLFVTSALAVAVLFATTACGDRGAAPGPDAARDAAGQDAPVDPDCDYLEQRDATNDDVGGGGTPEVTGLTLGARTAICGGFASTHFDGDITVDVDGFVVTAPADGDYLIRLYGAGAEAIELVGVDVYAGPSFTALVGAVTFYGDHGVAEVHLAAGTYELTAFALHSTAISAPVSYTLALVTDAPATRCPELGSGGYVESGDGASNDGNDVVTIPSGAPPALTAAATDAPEATGIELGAATDRISGSLADIPSPDQYEDKDTFAFTTGATTTELGVHLSWPGSSANLDFLVFEAGEPSPVFRAISPAALAPETRTVSVKPSTDYWILVGAKAGATGFPIPYAATLCGATFAP